MKVLIIDNFDSFTNNIGQYVYEVCGINPHIIPNNADIEGIDFALYDAIILSPGPGSVENEEDFGICKSILAQQSMPILGVCLGHQGINYFFGGNIQHAPTPVHGYRSKVIHRGENVFLGLPNEFEVVRYHSLMCVSVPDCLEVTAWTEDGMVMGLAHRERPIYGVQFHPESIDSFHGRELLANFLRLAKRQAKSASLSNRYMEAIREIGGPGKISLQVTELPAGVKPEVVYKNLFSSFESTFWLDSELCERPGSRYSLMGRCDTSASLAFSYEVASRQLTVTGPNGSTTIRGDFYELMDELLGEFEQTSSGQIPFPFQGGLVGYLGYELKGLKQKINLHRSTYPDALLYLPKNYIVFDHQDHKSWLCHVWGDSLDIENLSEHRTSSAPVSGFKPGAAPVNELNLEVSPQDYMDKIKQCLQEIRNGESYEICLTNRATMQFDYDSLEAYCRMRTISPVPYGAYFKNRDFSVLSASPEKFLTIEVNRKISSKPIKGTRPRSIDSDEDEMLKKDLAQSKKDRAENLMIVDLVRHDLNSICVPGSVGVPLAFDIESYSSVHQLVSTVEGQLPATTGPFRAIQACFPGGSMTGAPKIRTMDIIDRLERSPRGIYSGSIGWIGINGYTDLSIVIRTAVIKDGLAEFGIGGAIVADSDPEEELAETLVKASVPFHSLKSTKKVSESHE